MAQEARDTFLVDDDGNRHVPYLIWNDGNWQLDWNWLENDFNRNYRFVRLGKLLFMRIGGGRGCAMR